MEDDGSFGAITPDRVYTFQELSEREQNAVRIAIDDLEELKNGGRERHPMRIRVSDDKPFDMRSFTDVMLQLGVDIASSLEETSDGVLEFQPTFLPDDENSILDGVIVIPEGLEKYFK